MSENDLSLIVNGRVYLGWLTVNITRSIEAIAGAFSISLTDRWSIDDDPWPILPGDECVVKIGDDEVITGYVDQVSPSFAKGNRTLQISGRDRAGDLVDCSEDIRPGEFKGKNALEIAQALAASFGITVSALASVGAPFAVFAINPGETAFEGISRACQKRSLLPVSLPDGTLRLEQASNRRMGDPLVEGNNIISASANHSMAMRFSTYTIKSQSASTGEWSGANAAQMKATSQDSGVPRFRPLTIIESGDNNVSELKKRADWEASLRAGQGTQATIIVQGWRQAVRNPSIGRAGNLWEVNSIVAVEARGIQIEQDMLIKGLSFSLTAAEGTRTSLALTRPDAFLSQPPTPEKDPLT